MNYIEVSRDKADNPVKINYCDQGSGAPLILIHGWPLSHEMWEYQVENLVDAGYRVITYDRRGFGKSSKPWDGYSYDTLTDDLKAIIDHLNLDNITLVGFSMGGGEVVRYFSRHAGKGVSKAVLISAVTPCLLKSDSNPDGVPQEMFDGMAEKIKDDRINFLAEFGETFFGVGMLSKPISTASLDYYRTLASMASSHATLECMKAFSTTDFRSEMSKVNVPVLIIHGDADKTVPMKPTGEEAANMLPDSEFVIYEGAPHGLWFTEKERLNDDLLSFLAGSLSDNGAQSQGF